MRKTIPLLMLPALLATSAVWAQDDAYNANNNGYDNGNTSTATNDLSNKGYLSREAVGIKPQIGVINFQDLTGTTTQRGVVGATIDWNWSSLVSSVNRNLYLGPQTGLLYSHLGDPTSNFFGTNASSGFGTSNAQLFMIPADLKLGYAITDGMRLSAHGGGNVTYRTVQNAIALAPDAGASNSGWNFLPNIGGELEFGLGNSVAIGLRPDWTFHGSDNFFTGTVGIGVSLG